MPSAPDVSVRTAAAILLSPRHFLPVKTTGNWTQRLGRDCLCVGYHALPATRLGRVEYGSSIPVSESF